MHRLLLLLLLLTGGESFLQLLVRDAGTVQTWILFSQVEGWRASKLGDPRTFLLLQSEQFYADSSDISLLSPPYSISVPTWEQKTCHRLLQLRLLSW